MSILCNPHQLDYVQSRFEINWVKVEEYASLMRDEIPFDAVEAIKTPDNDLIVFNGCHRIESARKAGVMIEVEVRGTGDRHEAVWRSLAANGKNGLPRTRADIEKIIKEALLHPNAKHKSDRQIARYLNVTHPTVSKYRKELEASGKITTSNQVKIKRGEQEYLADRKKQIPLNMPEPEPTPEPEPEHRSPQVFIESENQRPTEEKNLYDCPRCGGKRTVEACYGYSYLTDPPTLQKEPYKIQCTQCHKHFVTMWHFDKEILKGRKKCETCASFSGEQNCPSGFHYGYGERCAYYRNADDVERLEAIEQEMYAEASQEEQKQPFSPAWQNQQPDRDENHPFEFYARDRVKILKAGLRVFRIWGNLNEIRELTLYSPETATWKHFERFETKNALKERIHELEQDDKTIFDNHLY